MDKVKRKIIEIDEELCDGCGQCMPACPEQAIQLVDTPDGKKARLVKELFCDGLGACLGSCPKDAIRIEERESEPYDEESTFARIKEVAPDMLDTHLKHLKEHGQELPKQHSHDMPKGFSGCPGARMIQIEKKKKAPSEKLTIESELRQWPIQMRLVPAQAPYFLNADLVIVADCVPFAYANFHQDFLKDKAIAIGCPKLDNLEMYIEKLTEIIAHSSPKSLTVIHMEVPCCFGLIHAAKEAMKKAGKEIPLKVINIGINGEIKK
jgi:ferredoxin